MTNPTYADYFDSLVHELFDRRIRCIAGHDPDTILLGQCLISQNLNSFRISLPFSSNMLGSAPASILIVLLRRFGIIQAGGGPDTGADVYCWSLAQDLHARVDLQSARLIPPGCQKRQTP